MENKRIEFLDATKGAGITLVIFAHSMSSKMPFLYSFLMPVFFFVSGYVFRKKPVGEVFIDKLNRLYIPFAFFFIGSWLFFLIPLLMKGNAVSIQEHLFLIKNVFIGDERNGGNVPIWFLVCNFSICILYAVILKYVPQITWQSLLCVGMGLAGNYMYWHHIVLPYKLDAACSSIIFFHLGYMARQKDWVIKAANWKPAILIPVVLISLAVSYYFSMLNIQQSGINKVNIIHNIVGDYLPFTLTGLFVLAWFILTAYKVGNGLALLNYYGRNSMVILGTHYITLHVIKDNIDKYIDVETLGFNVLLTVILLVLSLPLIYLAKRFVPAFTSYDKLIKTKSSVVQQH
jgi:fucose 4-O-acetylase-like acetyltransferase